MTAPLREFIWESADEALEDRRLRRPAIYVLLAIVVGVLGFNWPVMATGVEAISPIWMGIFRVSGAVIVVAVIAASSGNLRMPPRRDLPVIASVAVFRLAAVFVLVFTALELVPASRSAVLVWTTSLWTVPIAAFFLGETVSRQRWLGLTLGIAGVVVLFEPWGLAWDEPDTIVGHALLILGAVINAGTAVHIRGHRWTITPLQALPWQLASATVLLLPIGLAIDGWPTIEWTPQLVGVVVYQGALASGIALWASIVVFRNMATVSATLTLMGVPVVGVVSSVLLLDERLSVTLTLGLMFVIAGVSVNLFYDRGRATTGESEQATRALETRAIIE
ncbi:MAG: DMT family transporter [Acidimicrobiia bacterium]|nr:DMT family transporter [Acidimicrobiia bacterium]